MEENGRFEVNEKDIEKELAELKQFFYKTYGIESYDFEYDLKDKFIENKTGFEISINDLKKVSQYVTRPLVPDDVKTEFIDRIYTLDSYYNFSDEHEEEAKNIVSDVYYSLSEEYRKSDEALKSGYIRLYVASKLDNDKDKISCLSKGTDYWDIDGMACLPRCALDCLENPNIIEVILNKNQNDMDTRKEFLNYCLEYELSSAIDEKIDLLTDEELELVSKWKDEYIEINKKSIEYSKEKKEKLSKRETLLAKIANQNKKLAEQENEISELDKEIAELEAAQK